MNTREHDVSSLIASKYQLNSVEEKWETVLLVLNRLRLEEGQLKESITEIQVEIASIKLKDSIRNLKIRDTVESANNY